MDQVKKRIHARQHIAEKMDFWNPFKENKDTYELSLPMLKNRDGRLVVQIRGQYLEIEGDRHHFFSLPQDANRNGIQALYTNGKLRVDIPRIPEEETHVICVFDTANETRDSDGSLSFLFEQQSLAMASR